MSDKHWYTVKKSERTIRHWDALYCIPCGRELFSMPVINGSAGASYARREVQRKHELGVSMNITRIMREAVKR